MRAHERLTRMQGYEKFGIIHKDGKTVYREWAPGAIAAQLIGDFNGWHGELGCRNSKRPATWHGLHRQAGRGCWQGRDKQHNAIFPSAPPFRTERKMAVLLPLFPQLHHHCVPCYAPSHSLQKPQRSLLSDSPLSW